MTLVQIDHALRPHEHLRVTKQHRDAAVEHHRPLALGIHAGAGHGKTGRRGDIAQHLIALEHIPRGGFRAEQRGHFIDAAQLNARVAWQPDERIRTAVLAKQSPRVPARNRRRAAEFHDDSVRPDTPDTDPPRPLQLAQTFANRMHVGRQHTPTNMRIDNRLYLGALRGIGHAFD